MLIKNTQKAFTIIELMVVVAIIAILTAIVMTNFLAAKAKSRDAKRVSDLAQIQLALELFFDKCNQYPSTLTTGTPPSPVGVTAASCPAGIDLASFISSIPSNPTTPASNYVYAPQSVGGGTNNDYILMAPLENNNSALVDDIDGSPYSISCNDNNYCVGPK